MTAWLKSLGIDEDGKLSPFLAKLEKSRKVSYDASSKHHLNGYENDISGFYPKTHRLMSLGHDPFFGLIFGLLDILNGSITLIDSKGVIHQVKLAEFQSMDLKDKVYAQLFGFTKQSIEMAIMQIRDKTVEKIVSNPLSW